jgi:penicillin-binding protein 1A
VAGRSWLQGDEVRARVRARVIPALESRLGTVRLGDDFLVGWTGTVTLGPLELPGTRPEGPPVVRIERITVHPRLWALLSGRVEASRVVLSDVAVEAGPSGREVRALLQRMRAPRPPSAPASPSGTQRTWPEVVVEDLHLAFERHGRVEWGPLSARVRREDTEGVPGLEATAGLPGGGRAELSLRDAESGITGTLQVRELPAGPLLSLAQPPWRMEGGLLEGEARWEGPEATFSVAVKGLALSDPRLAPEPVGPLAFSAEGHARWDVEHHNAKLESLRVAVGERREASVEVKGEADWKATPRFSLRAELRPLTFEQALAALPPSLVPDQELARLEGNFHGTLTVSGPVSRREDWEVKAKLDVSKRKASDPAGPLAWLRAPFNYRPLTADGRGRELHIGPDNPRYVPFSELPRVLVRAVLRSEDAAFWVHRGFDFDSLSTLLLQPSDGKVRGGSTLTQQLAKNLFLSREKTYARKVKEAYLTLGLETSLSKERLLEVYFNIIEWGPGLYGIGEAARHYFGKDAHELGIRESAFLATIIPNPVRYHVYCTRGELSELWKKNVDGLLATLHEGGDITFTEYQDALDAPLAFACGDNVRQEERGETSAE